AAGTNAEAELLFTSLQQAFVNLRTGRPGKLPPPRPGYGQSLEPAARGMLEGALSCRVIGDRETVRAGPAALAERPGEDAMVVPPHPHLALPLAPPRTPPSHHRRRKVIRYPLSHPPQRLGRPHAGLLEQLARGGGLQLFAGIDTALGELPVARPARVDPPAQP